MITTIFILVLSSLSFYDFDHGVLYNFSFLNGMNGC